MQVAGLGYNLPLYGVFLVTATLILSSLELGFRLGRWRRGRSEREKEGPVGAMVGTMLGLVAFMLAFTFGMAASRFDVRKHLVIDEVNAIETAYLRAGLLQEPHRTVIRDHLRQYVEVRLEGVRPGKYKDTTQRSERLHDILWAEAVAVGEENPNSIVAGLFIQSLNEVFNLDTKRITAGLRSHIPDIIWLALYAISITGMAGMGYHAGLTGTSRSIVALGLAFTFSAVLILIADLDRPQQGFLQVNQQAMVDLRNAMQPPAPSLR